MDENTYREWSALHLRTVRGEPLTENEQAKYQAGLTQLDEEERSLFQEAWRRQQERVIALAQEKARLEMLLRQQSARIAELERQLGIR
jgi:hypothetical protein